MDSNFDGCNIFEIKYGETKNSGETLFFFFTNLTWAKYSVDPHRRITCDKETRRHKNIAIRIMIIMIIIFTKQRRIKKEKEGGQCRRRRSCK